MRISVAAALAVCLTASARIEAQPAKRVVLIKVDGLPEDFVERYINKTDLATGRYLLPWFHRVFIERGAVIDNFYCRGISLSAPSWSMLDTGQHLVIRGNADYDRAYPRVYDYLNFFPFYIGFARSRRADMPGVEVLDESGIRLFDDQFPYDARSESLELFQRGVPWQTLTASVTSRVKRPLRELIDEWQTGVDFGGAIMREQERELIAKLADPQFVYLDYFTGYFDHTAHLTNDESSQLNELRRIDAAVGRIWTAIGAGPLADSTLVAIVSDHGMNSTPGAYSQGYDLVRFFNTAQGGAHHVITNRHPRDEYKLSGLDPFVSWVTSPSNESTYLSAQKDFPTALLDLDGNERAAVQLRNSDLNELQIILEDLQNSNLQPFMRSAMAVQVMKVIERNRARWSATVSQLREELPALNRAIAKQNEIVSAQTAPRQTMEAKLEFDRQVSTLQSWRRDERGYSAYMRSLGRLLALNPQKLTRFHESIEELIPKGSMGDPNSLAELQGYVAGPAPSFPFTSTLASDGTLDEERSFAHINYFTALTAVRVRNSVEQKWGSAPVDFVAIRMPGESLRGAIPDSDRPDDSAIFLYRDPADEVLILPQHRGGELWLRYLPVSGVVEDERGAIHLTPCDLKPGLPLKIFEDPDLAVDRDRTAWLNAWHSERDWFKAVHRTRYSNAIIGLSEFFRSWQPAGVPEPFKVAPNQDWPLLQRFITRLRASLQPDMLLLANYGWNFNVRSFNPGGNHGSFFRISTHSVLMFAGAGIQPGTRVEEPYDSLNFVPTLMELMGKPVDGYPAPPITELTPAAAQQAASRAP